MNCPQHINRFKKTAFLKAGLSAFLLLCLCGSLDVSDAAIPDKQKASVSIAGTGVMPFAQISLSTGPQQNLVVKADANGQFSFENLQYLSFSNLKFSLKIPPFETGLSTSYPATTLEFFYDPRGSIARITGHVGKSGTVALNMEGSREPILKIAGEDGFVRLQTSTEKSISSGDSRIIASIVNVGEVCCPRMIVPANPITLTISSVPLTSAINPDAGKSQGSIPKIKAPPVRIPYISPLPLNRKPESKDKKDNYNKPDTDPKPKYKAPYIVQGRVDFEPIIIDSGSITAAASFSSSDYDRTYVGGLKKMADEIRNAIVFEVAAIGAMIDGRNLMDANRSLQISNAESLKNYTASDAVCRFGSLSKSMASGDSSKKKNQVAFTKLMMDRDTQKINSVYSAPAQGINAILSDFQTKYCETVDNNGFLEGYCKGAASTSDLLYNRDVDFTKIFDVPLTLDADFTSNAITNDKQSLIALFHNLSLVPPLMVGDADSFDPRSNSLATQDIRSANALRTVSANSFASLVAEKTKSSGTSASSAYMHSTLTQLGLSAADAKKLVGDNPSYFAQMEVMTKKLFQDPAFYANLYDSEANVDRQRVAMKAIELQQDRDLLENLRRREMLLSVILNARLRVPANKANESGIVVNKN